LPGYEWLKSLYNSEVGKERIQKVAQFQALIKDMGCTLAQASIAWCVKNPDVSTVLLGASSKQQLTENLASLSYLDAMNDSMVNSLDQIFAVS